FHQPTHRCRRLIQRRPLIHRPTRRHQLTPRRRHRPPLIRRPPPRLHCSRTSATWTVHSYPTETSGKSRSSSWCMTGDILHAWVLPSLAIGVGGTVVVLAV